MANELTTQNAAIMVQASPPRKQPRAGALPAADLGGGATPEGGSAAAVGGKSGHNRTGNPEALKAAVREINDYVQNQQRELNFSYDESAGRTVIKVMDSEGKVIRQIPPDEALALARRLHDLLDKEQPQGLLMKVKV